MMGEGWEYILLKCLLFFIIKKGITFFRCYFKKIKALILAEADFLLLYIPYRLFTNPIKIL